MKLGVIRRWPCPSRMEQPGAALDQNPAPNSSKDALGLGRGAYFIP